MSTAAVAAPAGALTQGHKKVIFASSLGTVFEWYDFYLYGSLAAIIAKQFFSGLNETSAFIFALLAFAAGFAVRPFGALVFGRLGDLVGRKYTFLVTIVIMGASTFLVGVLPNYASIGVAAPIILIALRLLQGLALGGEYGGAATYVAEHAPHGKRGLYTSFIQTTATLGLFLSLLVILGVRGYANTYIGPEAFETTYWRVPFLLSIVLLGVSVWIRLQLDESPLFQQMKAEGKQSKAPITESFFTRNGKVVLLALLGATAGQAVVWYCGQFYALYFLTQALKVDAVTANLLIAGALAIGTPFFILFGWLSDRIGRKKIVMAGCLIAALTYFPLFKAHHPLRQSRRRRSRREQSGRGARRSGDLLVPVRPGRQEGVQQFLRHRHRRARQGRRSVHGAGGSGGQRGHGPHRRGRGRGLRGRRLEQGRGQGHRPTRSVPH